MPSTATTTRNYPKRKRAVISYHESSSGESGIDDGYDTSDDKSPVTTRKVGQSILALFAHPLSSNVGHQKLKASPTTLSTKPLPKRKIFPFISLPAELKNQIYALALTDANGIFLASKTKRYRRTVQRLLPSMSRSADRYRSIHYRYHRTQSQSPKASADITLPALVPNLLLLNHAIYAETQPILYAGNAFAVEDTTAMHAFLANIGPKNRATITDLTVKGWGYTKAHKALNHPALTMLADAVSLKRLHFDCQITWGTDAKRKAKQLYRDAFHWLEAMGVQKGKFDAAVDIIQISDRYLTGEAFAPMHMHASESGAEKSMEVFRSELRKLLS